MGWLQIVNLGCTLSGRTDLKSYFPCEFMLCNHTFLPCSCPRQGVYPSLVSNSVTIIISLQTRSAKGSLILKPKRGRGRGCKSRQQEWPGERGDTSGVVIRIPRTPIWPDELSRSRCFPASSPRGAAAAPASAAPAPRLDREIQGWRRRRLKINCKQAAWWELGRAD